jgi:drug/metabolite transporter (DMT)-like permease
MVYLGAVPTALAFSTWAYALVRMDAGRLGVTTYLVPPIVILLGWLLLGEVPPALAFAGGVVCLAGVALSRGLRPRRRPEPAPVPVGEAAGPG